MRTVNHNTNRREFIRACVAGAACAALARVSAAEKQTAVPAHLKGREEQFRTDPRAAAMAWFRDAKFGLFIHYGLYALLGRGEWVQFDEKIPIAEYAKLKERFTAEKFDAPAIADLAVAAQMKYVTLVCKHCDSFCLWDAATTDFNSVRSAAGRDLVAEMPPPTVSAGWAFSLFTSTALTGATPTGRPPGIGTCARSAPLTIRPTRSMRRGNPTTSTST
jgi:alpha-L-fucosidase